MARVQIQTPQGVIELRDEVRNPIYDSFDILAGGAALLGTRSFFSNVQGKGRSQTNLRQNNILESMVSFRILGIGMHSQNIYAANANVMPLIMENSFVNLRITEKTYYEGPVTLVAGKLDLSVALDGAAAPVQQLYQRYGQVQDLGVVLGGKHFVDIAQLQSFALDWTVEGLTATEQGIATMAANTKLRVYGVLNGLLRRPVQ